MAEPNWEEIAALFPITKDLIYLDNAAMSPYCIPVQTAIERFLKDRALKAAQFDVWWNAADELRRKISRLVNCRPSQVAFNESTTMSMNIIAQGLPLHVGDNILLTEYEFPANVYPWLNLKHKGIDIRFVPGDRELISMDALYRAADDHTRVLSVSHVAFCNGFRADLNGLKAFCEERNIIFVVDGMQSVGALEIDFESIGMDALCFGGFKWLLGPDGLGFICCKENLLESLRPVYIGWAGMKNKEDFFSYELQLADNASRFELGNLNFSAIVTMNAALDFIGSIGIKHIEKRIIQLSEYLFDRLENLLDLGITLHLPRYRSARSQIVCFDTPNHDRMMETFKQSKIKLGNPGCFRAAPHFYNSFGELDTLISVVQNTIEH
jgi:cysteine desulfurase/selenocysteine lyase